MSIKFHHTILSKASLRWLVEAVDPSRPSAPPSVPFPAVELEALLRAAELHGVLPLVMRALRLSGEVEALRRQGSQTAATAVAAIDGVRTRQIHQAGMELLLRHHGATVLKNLHDAGLPAAIVKGPTFARRLYSEPALRSFTDIDILIPVSVREEASRVLAANGFVLHSREYRGDRDFFEDVWLLEEDKRVSLEVHSNLVHNPTLRQSASVRFEDVSDAGNGDLEDATALLFVAATHGAFSHQFDRLQHLVDVTLAAGGAAGDIDPDRLWSTSRKSGAGRAVYSGLMIAARTFSDQKCSTLAASYNPSRFDRFISGIITPQTVLDARSHHRGMASWRRKLFRKAILTRQSPGIGRN